MSIRRLRAGEAVALLGAVALLVLLFLEWFDGGGLGWFLVVLLAALAVGGVLVALLAMLDIAPAWPVGACVATGAAGVLLLIALAIVVLVHGDLRWPAIAGLVATALIPVGSFLALDDERAGAPESAVVLPPARPAPQS